MHLACFNKEAFAAAKKRVDNKAERKNKSLQNDDEEEEKVTETKAMPANEKPRKLQRRLVKRKP